MTKAKKEYYITELSYLKDLLKEEESIARRKELNKEIQELEDILLEEAE